jgi:hypothetical protein
MSSEGADVDLPSQEREVRGMIGLAWVRRLRKASLVAHAFFDDSKSFGKKGFICLAGYVSDDSGWDSFHREWSAVMGRHRLNVLHTSDFLSAHGQYEEEWKGTSYPDRVSVVRELIQIIQKHVICGVTIGIDGSAFREVFTAEKKKPPPEEFCFYRVMKRTIARCLVPDWQGMLPLHLVFDDSEHSMRFYKAYRHVKSRHIEVREAVCSIAFADDRFVGALNAADLLACATVREHRRDDNAWDEESPFRGLLQSKDPAYGLLYEQEYWDEDEIRRNKLEIIKMAVQSG